MTLVLSSSFQSYPGSRKAISDQKCGICLDFFGEKLKIVSHENSLYHVFHESCLKKWAIVKPECPLCRKEIVLIKNQGFLPSKKIEGRGRRVDSRVESMIWIYFVGAVCSAIKIPCIYLCSGNPISEEDWIVIFKQMVLGAHAFFIAAVITEVIYQRYML